MLGEVIGQITTIFALAGAYFGFGYLAIKLHNTTLVPLIPNNRDDQNQVNSYINAAATHTRLIYWWFLAGFGSVIVVIALLVLQSLTSSNLQYLNEVKVGLEEDVTRLEVQVNELEVNVAELQRNLNETTQNLYMCQASSPDALRDTLRDG